MCLLYFTLKERNRFVLYLKIFYLVYVVLYIFSCASRESRDVNVWYTEFTRLQNGRNWLLTDNTLHVYIYVYLLYAKKLFYITYNERFDWFENNGDCRLIISSTTIDVNQTRVHRGNGWITTAFNRIICFYYFISKSLIIRWTRDVLTTNFSS